MRHPWFVDGFEAGLAKGREEGRQEGRERGLAKGLAKGQAEGRQEGLMPLLYQLERRLGRALRQSEQKRIALRLVKDGPEKLGSVVLDTSKEELAAWLKPRKTGGMRRHASNTRPRA